MCQRSSEKMFRRSKGRSNKLFRLFDRGDKPEATRSEPVALSDIDLAASKTLHHPSVVVPQRNSGRPAPRHKLSNPIAAKQKNYGTKTFTVSSPPFSLGNQLPTRFAEPELKGIPLSYSAFWHYCVLIGHTSAQFLTVIVLIALIFSLALILVDADLRSQEDASFSDCFMTLISLLLTGTDDWAPNTLAMTPLTYIVIVVRDLLLLSLLISLPFL